MRAEIHDPSIKALRKVAQDKPYIIAETGTSGPNRESWFIDLGQWMSKINHQSVVAVCYFDYDKTAKNGNDWRVYPAGRHDAEQSRQTFRRVMAGF